MKEKFEIYLNKLFKRVNKTPEVLSLKDEILADLLEKSQDLKEEGYNEKDIYENCINNLGDLKQLLKIYKKEYSRLKIKVELPKYKLSEELINAISHGLGVLTSILFLVLGIIKANSGLALFSMLLYSISSIILYLMSCLYHSFKPNNAKRIFRIFDHCSIYLLIAGTYTPISLLILPLPINFIVFGIVWAIAIIGIILNSINIKKYKTISMILYLIAGWCIIFSFKSLCQNMNHIGILFTILGGVIYTIGAILYGIGKKKRYMHSIFHILCLLASIMFFLAIYLYVL